MGELREKYGAILAIVFVIAVLVIAVAPSGFLTWGYYKSVKPGTYTLTVSKAGTGTGTVISSPSGINCGADCSQLYRSGQYVYLSASPASDSTFAGWSGDCSGISLCRFIMNSDKAVTAIFNKKVVSNTLTVSKIGTGTGRVLAKGSINCGTTCSWSYAPGTSVSLYNYADSDSTFAGWSGACSGTSSWCTLIMNSNKEVGATFNKKAVPTNGTQIIDLSLLNQNFKGYNSVAFDGRYVYFMPLVNANGVHGNIVRYDTAQNLPNTTSFQMQPPWQVMDTKNSLSPSSTFSSYSSASFDGRYMYFAPAYSGRILRYDTTGNFTNNRTTATGNPSWESFNTQEAFGINYGLFNYTNVSFGSVNFYTSYSYYIAKYNGVAFGNHNSWSATAQTTPQNVDRNFTVTDNYGYTWYIVQKGVSTSGKVARYK